MLKFLKNYRFWIYVGIFIFTFFVLGVFFRIYLIDVVWIDVVEDTAEWKWFEFVFLSSLLLSGIIYNLVFFFNKKIIYFRRIVNIAVLSLYLSIFTLISVPDMLTPPTLIKEKVMQVENICGIFGSRRSCYRTTTENYKDFGFAKNTIN